MMRIAPAAKAFVYARANPVSRNVAFTALRMMSSAPPAVKVRVGNRFVLNRRLCRNLFCSDRGSEMRSLGI